MKKHLSLRDIIIAALIILTLAFIFSRSMLSIPDSKEESRKVMELILPLLEFFCGAGNVSINLVRKLAHFVEFGVLGLEAGLLSGKLRPAPFLFCLLAALTDETIQLFYARGSQVQDVWLDFAGAVTGILAGVAIMWAYRRFRSARPE